jgi:hypothetical protein
LAEFDDNIGLNFVTPQESLTSDQNRRELISLLIDRLEELSRSLLRVIPRARDSQDVRFRVTHSSFLIIFLNIVVFCIFRLFSMESMLRLIRQLSQWFRHNYDFINNNWAIICWIETNTLRNPYLFSCYIQLFIYFYIGRHILKLKYFLHRKTYSRICLRVYFKNTIFVIFNTIISVKVFIIIGHKINIWSLYRNKSYHFIKIIIKSNHLLFLLILINRSFDYLKHFIT